MEYRGRVVTLMSNPANLEHTIADADLLIGAVLIPAAKAPIVVTRKMVARMRPGSVIVDIAIDQGGCIEGIRPTSHEEPVYAESGVIHYAVPNMPALVGRTSTLGLTQATEPYVAQIVQQGLAGALADNRGPGQGREHPRRPDRLRGGRQGAPALTPCPQRANRSALVVGGGAPPGSWRRSPPPRRYPPPGHASRGDGASPGQSANFGRGPLQCDPRVLRAHGSGRPLSPRRTRAPRALPPLAAPRHDRLVRRARGRAQDRGGWPDVSRHGRFGNDRRLPAAGGRPRPELPCGREPAGQARGRDSGSGQSALAGPSSPPAKSWPAIAFCWRQGAASPPPALPLRRPAGTRSNPWSPRSSPSISTTRDCRGWRGFRSPTPRRASRARRFSRKGPRSSPTGASAARRS